MNVPWWFPPHVGQSPTAAVPSGLGKQATATADAYSYGAASGTLDEASAMQAWADLSAKQNTPAIQQAATTYSCPSGFLFAPDAKTCVNQRGTHIALGVSSTCYTKDEGTLRGYDSLWFFCRQLPLWFQLNHPVALMGYSTSVAEAKKMLPTALAQLDIRPGDDLKTEIHALARVIAFQCGNDRDCNLGKTEAQIEVELLALAQDVEQKEWKLGRILPQTDWTLPILGALAVGALVWFFPPARSFASRLFVPLRPLTTPVVHAVESVQHAL